MLVFDVEEDVHHIHVSAQRGHRLLVFLLLIILRRRLLAGHQNRNQQDRNYPTAKKKRSIHSEGLLGEVRIVSLDAETPLAGHRKSSSRMVMDSKLISRSVGIALLMGLFAQAAIPQQTQQPVP